MTKEEIDFPTVIRKFDKILERGLCYGIGDKNDPESPVCIEVAISLALGLPFSDNPKCVASSVRAYKIQINDSSWSSAEARAKGLRNIGIAQIGSKGVVNDVEFSKKLAEKTIRILIPALFRKIFTGKVQLEVADNCERLGTEESAREARNAAADAANADAAYAANAATYAAAYADSVNAAIYAAYAANAATYADSVNATYADFVNAAYADSVNADSADSFLILSVDLALQVLQELKSPGCEWI